MSEDQTTEKKSYTVMDVMTGKAPRHIMLRYAALALIDPGEHGFIATGPRDPRLSAQDRAAMAPKKSPRLSSSGHSPAMNIGMNAAGNPVTQSGTELLFYTAEQVCEVLQIEKTTLHRLGVKGLLCPNPELRHKRYSVRAVRRFAEGVVDEKHGSKPKVAGGKRQAG